MSTKRRVDDRIYAVRSPESGDWYTGEGWDANLDEAEIMTLEEAEKFVRHDGEEIVSMQIEVIRRPHLIVNRSCTCGGKEDGWHGKSCAKYAYN